MRTRREAVAEVLPTHTPALFASALRRVVERLRAGDVVALPTETVYGLAANALNPKAVARIFEVKRRPADNPVIVHVAGLEMARRCVSVWPPAAERLATAFWPGPLTLVLPKSSDIPDIVTAGGPTVGVRWPNHPFIQAVIRRCGFPLAAPSANLSSELSPTTAAHVQRSLGNRIQLIVDGGASPVGIESTVMDLGVTPPRLLRPGVIHAESLLAAAAEFGLAIDSRGPNPRTRGSGQILRSPGQLPKHYSPKARLLVWSWDSEADLRSRLNQLGCSPSRLQVLAHTRIPSSAICGRVCVMSHAAETFARGLYAELHRCDDEGAEAIVVEAVPETPEWAAIRDRLGRAASRE